MTRARTVRVCIVRGCEDRTVGRGLCRRHYDRVRRGGRVETAEAAPVQPPAGRPPRPKALPARLDPQTRRLLRAALDHHPALLEALVEAGRRA